MAESNENLHGHWDTLWQKSREDVCWFEGERFIQKLFDEFYRVAPLKQPILDLGCGRGAFLQYCRSRQVTGIGCDFSWDSLQASNAPRVNADACKLPFLTGKISSLVSILLIEHIPDYSSALNEMVRVLKPGGGLYLVFPNLYSIVTPVLAAKAVLGLSKIAFHQTLNPKKIEDCLTSHGMSVLSRSYLSIGSFRGGVDALVSGVLRKMLPVRFLEEVIIVAEKAM